MPDTAALFQTKLDRWKGRQEQIQKTRSTAVSALETLETLRVDLEDAQAIVQTVAKITQQQLEYKVSELVSLALEAVFPEPYKMALDFELRRGKTEADITLIDPHNPDSKVNPMSSTGGGVVDVASFGLRVACWSMRKKRTRSTIILDEPFRYLSGDLQEKASLMLKEISDRLGIQFIIVSHEQQLIDGKIDKLFEVRQRNGVSYIVGQESKKTGHRTT